jgi:hypothetical protein
LRYFPEPRERKATEKLMAKEMPTAKATPMVRVRATPTAKAMPTEKATPMARATLTAKATVLLLVKAKAMPLVLPMVSVLAWDLDRDQSRRQS